MSARHAPQDLPTSAPGLADVRPPGLADVRPPGLADVRPPGLADLRPRDVRSARADFTRARSEKRACAGPSLCCRGADAPLAWYGPRGRSGVLRGTQGTQVTHVADGTPLLPLVLFVRRESLMCLLHAPEHDHMHARARAQQPHTAVTHTRALTHGYKNARTHTHSRTHAHSYTHAHTRARAYRCQEGGGYRALRKARHDRRQAGGAL